MGNDQSALNSRMGVTAMAFTTGNIEKAELLAVAEKFRPLLAEGNVGRADFEEALKVVEKFEASDVELFMRLFTMFDNAGENTIPFREYLSGVGGCLINDSLKGKLRFAFDVYDFGESEGQVTRLSMRKVLNSMNLVASYFGDPVVTPEQIDAMVTETFNKR